ncbi:hypothetical protein Rhopal_005602-T1 [Rhodotorula paludigena]|uniref:Uncharacterized protein n=1 Tax=Rhodotorula paludigena TaxID=86838 RepID=A0AAV5GU51_9BASI|nr:hypothetical protein Rhopal_005602-T1 [Rhodotorula paludigena]
MTSPVRVLRDILDKIPSTWDAHVPLWLETPEEEFKLKRLKKDAIDKLKLRWNLFREDTHEHFRRQVGQVAALVEDGILTKVSELLVDDDGLEAHNNDEHASLPPLWQVARFPPADELPERHVPQPFRHTVLRPGPPDSYDARLQPSNAPPQPFSEQTLGKAPVLGRRAALYYSFAR